MYGRGRGFTNLGTIPKKHFLPPSFLKLSTIEWITLRDLLLSQADEISPLSGVELVKEKVKLP